MGGGGGGGLGPFGALPVGGGDGLVDPLRVLRALDREDEAAACKYCDSRAEEQQDQLDKAVLKGMGVVPGEHAFRLVTSTDIPMQAGLAGSTALMAAVYGAEPEMLPKVCSSLVVQ